MKLFIMGAGRMGSWLAEMLSPVHAVFIYDPQGVRLREGSKSIRIAELSAVRDLKPEMVINAVSLHRTRQAFQEVLPFLPPDCLLADIASVKTGFLDLYRELGKGFVSSHPMFGPTFSGFRNLEEESAILIRESCAEGKSFFRDFYHGLNLQVQEYSFEEHDETIAYSLSIPFASSMVFAASMKKQAAPGTTFKKHRTIARAVLSEDTHLLAEIMFNPNTIPQLERINSQLTYLTHIIRGRDYEEMEKFLNKLRENME
jgi:prephenate dehydrogenase